MDKKKKIDDDLKKKKKKKLESKCVGVCVYVDGNHLMI